MTLTADVAFVADEIRYRKRIDDEYRGQVSKDMMQSGIDFLYEENAQLTQKLKEQKEKCYRLQSENILLKERNEVLKKELNKLHEKENERKGQELGL